MRMQGIVAGASRGAGPVVLDTHVIVNSTGSAIPANSIPNSFGRPFKQGDIPAGQWPKVELTDGTPVPNTPYQPNYYPDGSMSECSFWVRPTVGIPAHSNLTINILSGGSAPAPSARTTNDLLGQNYFVKAIGLGTVGNLTGTWEAPLNDGITNTNQSNSTEGNANNYSDAYTGANADIYCYGDGPVGKYLRIRSSLQQSGSPHGFVEVEYYCMLFQDASGNHYGNRILPRMKAPWFDTSVTKTFFAFSTLQFWNGATLLNDQMAGSNPAFGTAQPFTFTANPNEFFTCPTQADQNALMGLFGEYQGYNLFCVLGGSGTLPGGTAANTPYWAQTAASNLTQFTLQQSMGAYGVSPTANSSGSCTVTTYPYLAPFGAESFSNLNGTYIYDQGGGSVATDTPCQVLYNKSYWIAAGALPPYTDAITPTATPNPVPTKVWNIIYPFIPDQGATGGRPDIGIFSAYTANHAFTQDPNDEQSIRVLALAGMTESYNLRSATYRTIPIANNTAYSGCVPANPNFQWDPSTGDNSGVTDPPASGGIGDCIQQVWEGNDFSHKPEFTGYVYMVTGEVDKLDHLVSMASATLYTLYPGPTYGSTNPGVAVADSGMYTIGGIRNANVDGVDYWGHLTAGQQGRTSAWAMRYCAFAEAFAQSHPENPNYSQYPKDIRATTFAAWNAFLGISPSFVTTNKLFNMWDNTSTAPWQSHAYLLGSLCLQHGLTADPSALSMINYLVGYHETWYNEWGSLYAFPYYEHLTKAGLNSNQAPMVAALNQIGVSDLGGDVSWTTSGFTLQTVLSGNYVIANGDVINFDANYGVPANLAANVPYYVISLSGTGVGATFKLTTVSGNAGNIVNPTNSSSGNTACYFQKPPGNNWPATGFLQGNGGTENYSTIIPTTLRYALQRGATINTAAYNDAQTRLNFYNPSFVTEAQWDLAA